MDLSKGFTDLTFFFFFGSDLGTLDLRSDGALVNGGEIKESCKEEEILPDGSGTHLLVEWGDGSRPFPGFSA